MNKFKAEEHNSFSAFLCIYFDIVLRLERCLRSEGKLCKFCRYL